MSNQPMQVFSRFSLNLFPAWKRRPAAYLSFLSQNAFSFGKLCGSQERDGQITNLRKRRIGADACPVPEG
jgi:hypothetical protein